MEADEEESRERRRVDGRLCARGVEVERGVRDGRERGERERRRQERVGAAAQREQEHDRDRRAGGNPSVRELQALHERAGPGNRGDDAERRAGCDERGRP